MRPVGSGVCGETTDLSTETPPRFQISLKHPLDETGDLRRFVDCLQEVLDLLLAEIDRFPEIWDIERAPESFLDLILRNLGNPFAFDLSELGAAELGLLGVGSIRA